MAKFLQPDIAAIVVDDVRIPARLMVTSGCRFESIGPHVYLVKLELYASRVEVEYVKPDPPTARPASELTDGAMQAALTALSSPYRAELPAADRKDLP